MNRLEERYRRVLRLLPAGHRRRWEDDMVAAFLASTATGDPERDEYLADYGRPGAGEVASVVALAARLRFGGAGAPPRRYAWGQAVRLAVLLTTLTSAVVTVGVTAVSAWPAGGLGLPVPAAWALPHRAVGLWSSLSGLSGWAWVVAFLALVAGHRRAALLSGLLAVLVSAVAGVLQSTAGNATPALALAGAVGLLRLSWPHWLIQLLTVLGMGAFQPGTPAAHRRGWLIALPAGVVLVGMPVPLIQFTVPALRAMDWPATLCVLTTVGAAGYLLASLTGRPRRTPDRTLALLLLTTVAFLYRLTTLPGVVAATPAADRPTQLTAGLVILAALLAVAVPLLVTTLRAWQHLPTDPDPAPATPPTPQPGG